LLPAPPIRGDTLQATRGSIREVRHVVRVSFKDGAVIAKVRRSFKNVGDRVDQAELSIRMPPGAAATGLRIKGSDRWHRGDLYDAAVASEAYRSLTGYRDSRFPPKDPALLHWGRDGVLELKIFPVLLDRLATVEYTLTIAPKYEGGEYYVSLPLNDGMSGLVAPTVVFENEPDDSDGVFLGGERVDVGERVRVVPRAPRRTRRLRHVVASDEVVAGFRTRGIGLHGRLGVVAVSSRTSIARLELDAMPQLTEMPRKAQVVFVLDASQSAAGTLATQLAVVRTFGRLLPDADVEIVRFDRRAKAVFDGFVTGADLDRRLADASAAGAFEGRHGSNADRGLALAASLVKERPGPRRIVLLSDERFRRDFSAADLERASRASSAIVHVLRATERRSAALKLHGAGRYASVAYATGGVAGDVSAIARDAYLDEALLELVRPVRLDDASVTFAGRSVALGSVAEGGRALFFGFEQRLADDATVRGTLWSAPYERVFPVDTNQRARTAAAVFARGRSLYHELTPAQGRRVARVARAVSPWTSYLAIEPGVRPTREGFGDEDFTVEGGVAGGVLGGTIGGTLGGVDLGAPPPFPHDPYEGWWKVADCERAVEPPKGWRASIRIERTDHEIVAMKVERTNHSAMARCLVEAAWQTPLPAALPTGDHVDNREVR